MESDAYQYKLIKTEEIRKDFPFQTRYRLDDGRLRKSIAEYGLRNPLVVTADKFLLSGHKRLAAAQANKIGEIPVLELQSGAVAKQGLFLAALFFNWGQFASEFDKAWSIRRAKQDFSLDKEHVMEDVLPVLGLPPEPGIYERYLQIANLESGLRDLIAGGALPFRGIHVLLRLNPSDQDVFASSIARRVRLTTNQLLQTGEWLSDLLRMSKIGLKRYLKESGLEMFLDSPDRDGRAKAERFYQAVRALRFPQLAAREKKFKASLHRIEDEFEGLSVRAPSSFEEEGITLSAKVRNPESLARLVEKMQDRYPLFHSLFDVLG